MSYHAGQLDQRITFKRQSLTRDAAGGTAKGTPTSLGGAWALVRELKGREREVSQRLSGTSDYLVVVRFRADVQDDDYIVWGNRTLNIRFIRNRGQRQAYLEIEASMGDPV